MHIFLGVFVLMEKFFWEQNVTLTYQKDIFMCFYVIIYLIKYQYIMCHLLWCYVE